MNEVLHASLAFHLQTQRNKVQLHRIGCYNVCSSAFKHLQFNSQLLWFPL
ncbi:UNVERIFIED_CONTAM: hypothetical protein FKN15_054026 [Acipenser sinensis]